MTDTTLMQLQIVLRLYACLHYLIEPDSHESVQECKRTGKLPAGYNALLDKAFDSASKLWDEVSFGLDQIINTEMADPQPWLSYVIRTRLRPRPVHQSPMTLECFNKLATATTIMLNETAEFYLQERIIAILRTLHRLNLQTPRNPPAGK